MKKVDIAIIGAGPAGMAAAIYALRANKTIALFEKEVEGGQMSRSPLIENYPGVETIAGSLLANKMYEQIVELGGDIEYREVKQILVENNNEFFIMTDSTALFKASAVIFATGGVPNTLGVPNEKELIGNGVYFCATCDGPLFKGKPVVVIGDGNSAAQYAIDLASYCQDITMISNADHLFCESKLSERLQAIQKIHVLYNTKVEGFINDNGKFGGVDVIDSKGHRQLLCDAAFIAIGQSPSLPDIVYEEDVTCRLGVDNKDYIVADESCLTSVPGIFAAGDCRTKKLKQVVGATSDGAMAAIQAIRYLEK